MADETQEGTENEDLGANPKVSADIMEVFEHDPFPNGEAPVEETLEGDAAEGEDKTSDSPKGEGEDTLPASTEPETPETPNNSDAAIEDVEKEALEALKKLAPQTPQAPQQPQVQQQQQTQPETEKPKEAEIPNYAFQIPPELVNALASEDVVERTKGVQTLVAATGQAVHRQVMEQVTQLMATQQQNVMTAVQTNEAVVQQAQSVEKDYYGAFPTHEAVKPLVAQAADEILKETGYQGGWNEQLRNAVGARVNAKLQKMGFVQADPGTTPAAPKPPYTAKPRAANAKPTGDNPNSPEQIFDTLF